MAILSGHISHYMYPEMSANGIEARIAGLLMMLLGLSLLQLCFKEND